MELYGVHQSGWRAPALLLCSLTVSDRLLVAIGFWNYCRTLILFYKALPAALYFRTILGCGRQHWIIWENDLTIHSFCALMSLCQMELVFILNAACAFRFCSERSQWHACSWKIPGLRYDWSPLFMHVYCVCLSVMCVRTCVCQSIFCVEHELFTVLHALCFVQKSPILRCCAEPPWL